MRVICQFIKTVAVQNVIAGVRPSSMSKPDVNALKSRGVEVRILDTENWSIEQLAGKMHNVDIVISAYTAEYLDSQRSLVDAAKKAGVKRFIPNDWATACVPGVRKFHDAVSRHNCRYISADDGT